MNTSPENGNPQRDSTESQSAPLREGVSVRVLIVDDSRPSADALGAYLQAGGMSVRTVYHGSDALREAKAWIPDCIVLDVAMPGLSGIGVAAALQRIEATEKIPLLACTALDTADYSREMKEVGFYAIFRKPAELARLEDMIFGLVDRTAAGDFDGASSNLARAQTPTALDLANNSGVSK